MGYNRNSDEALGKNLAVNSDAQRPVEPVVRVPEWTRVNDRLPTHIYSVLGFVVDGGLAKFGGSMQDIVVFNPENGEWLQNIGSSDVSVAVSHWMDLPRDPAP
jgi:hypothetical protein